MCFDTICTVTNRILIICLHHLDWLMIVCIHQNTELSIFVDSYNWAQFRVREPENEEMEMGR